MNESSTFSYRAARQNGALETGSVDAMSRDEASSLLSARDLFPIEISAAEAGSHERRTPLAVGDLALGLRLLGTLLEAGLPISRTLAAFEELAPGAWRVALPSIRDAIRGGESLATALAHAPIAIPPIVIGIARAGEAGSGLGAAMSRAADHMERAAATRAAIRGALAYPIILVVVGSGSLALLVGVVLPRFAAILADLGQALPPATRLVIAAAHVARATAIPALIVTLLATAAWRAWTATEHGLTRWHSVLLTLPLVGAIRLGAASARVVSALAALVESGVPIGGALAHAARASGDAEITRRVLGARERVIVGSSLSSALGESRALTSSAVRLVRAGEETGRLAPMLVHAARIEDDRAQHLVRGVVRLLEPALIVMFGGVVAVVAAALLQAVYSVRPGS